MKNNCECHLCIYQGKGRCRLGAINHDATGMCQSCVLVEVGDAFLELVKRKQFEELEKRLPSKEFDVKDR
ncbi:MAG: hypothetical protein LBH24_03655 [Clostridiales bacterium]|jgi:hypothetical protein|nr:hypothetical protein [Clostridiales bacterium]